MPISPEEMTFDDLMDVNDPDFNNTEDNDKDEDPDDPEEDNELEEVDDVNDEEEETDEEDTDDEEDLEDTKEEDIEEEDSDDDFDLYGEISEQLGVEVEGEFEDSVGGLAEYVDKVGTIRAQQEFEKLPDDAKHFLQYRVNGGDPKEYFDQFYNVKDWTKTELSEDREEQHKEILKESMRKKGHEEDEIKEQIEELEAAGLLYNQAQRDLKYLRRKQKQEEEEILKRQEDQLKDQKRQQEEMVNTVKETIKKNDQFKNIPLKPAEKDDFFKYIVEPVEGDLTQRDVDVRNADLETKLAFDLLLYYDLNLEEIIENRAKSKKVQSLKEKLRRSKERNIRDKKSKNQEVLQGDDVDVDNLGDLNSFLNK